MKSPPLVSVIVPCYNHACYLPDALESVLAQTYPHWECIIVNDCSPDNTREVVEAWMVKDTRFQLVNAEKNGGLAASRNLGIAHSKGEYILPLDADDAIANIFLEECINKFSTDSNLKLVYSDVQCFGTVNEVVRRPDFSIQGLCYNNLIHCTAMYKKNDYNNTCGYRTNMLYGYEDWDFWLQLLINEHLVYHIKEPLFLIRVRPNSMALLLTTDADKEEKMRVQLKANNHDFFKKYLQKNSKLKSLLNRVFPAIIN